MSDRNRKNSRTEIQLIFLSCVKEIRQVHFKKTRQKQENNPQVRKCAQYKCMYMYNDVI